MASTDASATGVGPELRLDADAASLPAAMDFIRCTSSGFITACSSMDNKFATSPAAAAAATRGGEGTDACVLSAPEPCAAPSAVASATPTVG